MNWFDIIKEDEFSPRWGEFPGTTSEAIAEELSNDNVKIIFDEKHSKFVLTVSHSKFGEIYTNNNIQTLSSLTSRVEQANKYIKFIDEILKVFKNKIHEHDLLSEHGVNFWLVIGKHNIELQVVFWRSDSDLAFMIQEKKVGTGVWEYLSEGRTFENMWNFFTRQFRNYINTLGE